MALSTRLRPTLLYDADCRGCRFAARFVARIDCERALAIMPLQDPGADALLAAVPERERLASWRLAAPDGAIAGYGAGLPALLRAMRPTRPLGRLLGLVPASVLDAAYGLIARNRGRLAKLVPDGPAPRRPP
jgi:predicted DCC family thiol-disulfide oxidoreductase YuxK